MRSFVTVVAHKLGDQVFQMAFPEDDEMIQALPFYRRDPAFGIRVQVGGAEGDLQDVAFTICEELIEFFRKFGVTVADEGCLAGMISEDRVQIL